MALRYDLTKCAAWDVDEATQKAEWEVTEGIIFTTMGVGLGSITEANEAIFYARQYVWNKLNGFPPYTPEQIHSYVGLTTNVSDETQAQWNKRMMNGAILDCTTKYKKALDKQ